MIRVPGLLATRMLLVAVVALAAASGVEAPADGAPASCGHWSRIVSPGIGTSPSELGAVAATSDTDAWAVGDWLNGLNYRTLIERWDGTTWSVAPSPNMGGGTNSLTDVAALSPTDAWAVGFSASGASFRTLAMHWDGGTWTTVPTPNLGRGENALLAIAAASPTDLWAVGYRQDRHTAPRRPLILHGNGTKWRIVPSPGAGANESFLYDVTVPGPADAWAVGSAGNAPRTLRWNGRTWSPVRAPMRGDGANFLFGVAASSPTNVRAVGTYEVTRGPYVRTRSLAQRWTGTRWVKTPSADPAGDYDGLNAVAAAAPFDWWAVGERRATFPGAFRTLAEHWDGSRWSVAWTPNLGPGDNHLFDVARIPGASAFWAVGSGSSSNGDVTLIARYC